MTKRNRKSRRHSIFRAVIIILVSIFVGASAYSINASRVAHNNLPMPFGYGISVVLTGSMEPTLKIDDLTIVHQQKDYGVGDIVVFQSKNELIVHRIIEKNNAEIITKGDANSSADDPIDSSAIKGRVVCSIPFIGKPVNMLKTPAGIIIVIALAVALMELSFRTERRKDSEDIEKIKEEIRRLKEGE